MRAHPPAELIDEIYLEATLERLRVLLASVRSELGLFRREIEPLATEPQLPDTFRQAYGRIVSLLSSLRQTVDAAHDDACTQRLELPVTDPATHGISADAALIAAARQTIARINDVEAKFLDNLESAHKALTEHADGGVFDWSNPFEYELSVTLDPGPERRCYETCDEGDPLRIPVRSYTPDPQGESRDWNLFRHFDGHPLGDQPQGYLAHCIVDHTSIPWEVLPYIGEIGIDVSFGDFETVSMWMGR